MIVIEPLLVRVWDTALVVAQTNQDGSHPLALLEPLGRHVAALEAALDAALAVAGLPPRDTDIDTLALHGRLNTLHTRDGAA